MTELRLLSARLRRRIQQESGDYLNESDIEDIEALENRIQVLEHCAAKVLIALDQVDTSPDNTFADDLAEIMFDSWEEIRRTASENAPAPEEAGKANLTASSGGQDG